MNSTTRLSDRPPSRLLTTLVCASLAIICQAHAQSSIDNNGKQLELTPLTVTSSLREDATETQLTTSATVLNEEALAILAEQHFEELVDYIPNLNVSSATNRGRYFQIRGIGERSQYEGAPNPSVGFVIDDIDFSGISSAATLFDIDQLEVLRGPQGTRYGANALAGLIYVTSNAPEFTPAYRLTTLWGDDGDRSAGFSATGPVGDSDQLAYRFSAQSYRADGFRVNDFFNVDNTNERDELVSRTRFAWQPTAQIDVNVTLLYADIDNGFDTFNPENQFITHADDPGRDAQRSLGGSVRIDTPLGQAARLVSISSVSDSDILYSFDGDWGNDEYWGDFAPYDFTASTDRQRRNISQEFRLISTHQSRLFNDSTDWLAGLYILDLEEDNRFEDFFNDEVFRDLDSEYESTSVAAFGQLDSELSPGLIMTTGLRIEQRSANYRDTNGLNLSPDDTMVGGQLSLSKSLDNGQQIYTTLARGYKAGGFNLGVELPENRRAYDPEYLWNIEVGSRGWFMNGRLSTNLSVFYSRREDMQVSTSFQSDPTDPLTFLFFTDNAASGENYGLELETRYLATRQLTLHASLGLLEARFRDFVSADSDLSGRDQAHAPGYQFALGMEYRADNGLFGRLDVTGRDGFYFSDSHDQQSESYELVHLKAGYQADTWTVNVFANNLLDERYSTRGFFFGIEPPDFPSRLYTQLGNPRHVGVQAELRF